MKTLEKKLILNSFIPDIASAFIIFSYAIFSTQITLEQIFPTIRRLIGVIILLQFGMAIITDHFAYRKISQRYVSFEQEETTVQERTTLFEDLMRFPFYTALMTFLYFLLGACYISWSLYYEIHVEIHLVALFIVEVIFGTFLASLAGYTFSYKICSRHAMEVAKQGIEVKYAMEKKFFGLTLSMQLVIYVLLPAVFTLIINSVVLAIGYYPFDRILIGEDPTIQIQRMINTSIINTLACTISSLLFYHTIHKKNSVMNNALLKMTQSDFMSMEKIDTDISDEFSYNQFLSNQIMELFNNLLGQTAEFGKTISKSAIDLNTISNETESTSVEQSTGTKEIVSTMENATILSHDIANKITQVTKIAKETVNNTEKGSILLEKSLDSMKAIDASTEDTIKGINELNSKIKSIWEIASIIDTISDQTKIIAFNAELEATTSAGESKNFKNVSNEIRRLANSTMDSTREIKSRLMSIQNSAQNLLRMSEENTSLIRRETNLTAGIESKFANINNSAMENSSAAEEIKYLVEQQTNAFDQIVKTLQQISSGIQSFSDSTRTLTDTSRNLQENVGKLEEMNLHSNYTESRK